MLNTRIVQLPHCYRKEPVLLQSQPSVHAHGVRFLGTATEKPPKKFDVSYRTLPIQTDNGFENIEISANIPAYFMQFIVRF